MNTIEINCEQRTPEWFAARAGCVTGSAVANVLAKIKTGEAATRRNYRMKLAVERLTNKPQESGFKNEAMQWGIDQEPFARSAYESEMGLMVVEKGFIRVVDEYIGFSPDGFVGDDGLLEIKCPNSATHFEWLESKDVPAEHIPQIQFGLWVTGRKWCDFVSYDSRFPEPMQLFIVRVVRDEAYISNLAHEVSKFNKQVSEIVNKYVF